MQIKPQVIKSFQKEILAWYTKNKRDLPWRRVPVGTLLRDRFYRVLVSEIMLQQTQVSRVIPKYKAWLKAFPTVESLAKAKTADVLRLWSGLGYNRRALYLKKSAVILSEAKVLLRMQGADKRRDSSPSAQNDNLIEELKKLPGIGEYTARAIACFAFDMQVAVVDTNVRKVIEVVILNSFQDPKKEMPKQVRHDKMIQDIADELLPVGKAYDWNHALMDYAGAVLKDQKIPIIKQSKFKGSNRYYRGQIMKLLVAKEKVAISSLTKEFSKDSAFLQKIIDGLVRDGLITSSKGSIFLMIQ